jgi:NTP pyrophosphatase (non-canonical NTP hydrolase)
MGTLLPLNERSTMDFTAYQALANKTAKVLPFNEQLVHAALGLSSEAGEFTSVVKRIAIYEKYPDIVMCDNMEEELGDLLWYIALAAETLRVPMKELAERNILKLRKRYPEQFSNEQAENRADKNGADHRSS